MRRCLPARYALPRCPHAVIALLFCALASGPAAAQQEPPPPSSAGKPAPPKAATKPKRFFVGGGLGIGFGDVTWIEVSPLLGYRVAPRLTIGGSLLYRYRDDERYAEDLTASDYGAGGFVRGDVYEGFFVQGEYEYLSYEFPLAAGGTDREGFSSILVGPGYSSPLGGRASLYVAALYNFSYDQDDLTSPYDDPWVIRVCVGFAF